MPKSLCRPGYLLHKPTGQARVRIDGRDHYLGPYGSPESHSRYDVLIDEWLRRKSVERATLTIDELCLKFLDHANAYYVKNAKVTAEVACIRAALRPLVRRFGTSFASEFGPLRLKEVRCDMIRAGWKRSAINRQVQRIVRMFRWAVEEELLPETVHRALASVRGLSKGRTEAVEGEPVKPVSLAATGDATDKSKDRVTKTVYDGPSRLQQLVAMDANADGNLSDNQVTTYLYEDAVDASRKTNEIYPDSSDTTSSGTNQVKLAYNVDGSLSQKTDQRGTVIGYSYSNNRLPAVQSVNTLGTGVDGAVRSIARTYDNLNRVQNVTSYASTGGTGTVVNDIQYAYNDFGQIATAWQSHSGAVNTSSTLSVQYTYDTTVSSNVFTAQHRLQTEVHPNSRAIYFDYGSSGSSTAAYSATSTIREIWDGSPSGTGLAVYDYNGAGSRLALATYPQPSFGLNYFQGTSGTYAGLDRFGRVVDQYWKGTGSTADVDRIHYAYDYAGNRTYRDIDSAIYATNNLDQAYTYDGLHRLLTSQVGTLSGTTISGTPASEEDWTLDALGNWPAYVQKASGTTTLNQTRTASAANEISGISASVGPTWATPAYDLAGNMTTIPKPAALTSSFTAAYDAWNRMVSIVDGTNTVAVYQYDGLNRRTVKAIYASGSLDHSEHAYFNEGWQILEVRKETGGTSNSNPLEQYVWHPFYIDALVLRDYDAAVSGSPTHYYYAFDANYNVTGVATSSGSPAERYVYSPYGNITFLDGSFTLLATQQSAIGTSVTYTGRQFDAESGVHQYRKRCLHSSLGLFLMRDPAPYIDGVQLYEYARSAPVANADAYGDSCRVATRCGPATISYGIPSGQTHCGIVLDYNGQLIEIDGSGGPTNTFEIYRPPPRWPGAIMGPWSNLPNPYCACLFVSTAFWNGLEVQRDPTCHNSNWSLKCLTARCHLQPYWDPNPGSPLGMPIGWDCKECEQWQIPPTTYGCPTQCLKWRGAACPSF